MTPKQDISVNGKIRRQCTIKEVASAAGVSVGTVSKILSGSIANFAPKTVAKIRQTAEDLYYVPNRLVRSLQSRKNHVLTIRLSSIFQLVGKPYNIYMYDMLAEQARKHGYDVLLHLNRKLTVTSFLDGTVDGAILSSLSGQPIWTKLAEIGFPCVVIAIPDACKGVGLVGQDERRGMTEAVNYLASLGHRRIGYHTTEPHNSLTCKDRLEAFQAEMARLELAVPNERVFTGSYGLGQGSRAVRQWLSLPDGQKPTAVICDTYNAAVEASREFQRQGLSVPGDVSIIGYDDLHAILPASPPITVLTPPHEEMAREAVDFLVAMVDGASAETCRHVHPMQLRIKGSTGPCKDAR